uniref:ATPase family protein n=1 Tax=Mimiviridae sp. ChoanoV1 TaxID=2596887 RepID=A0A5B8IQU9_9VIRU|nr:ATPase family protein [Mimiviridae sp. ChoanoV1]
MEPKYQLKINNGNIRIGLAVKYYGNQFLIDKSVESLYGKIYQSETQKYFYMLNYGLNKLTYKDYNIDVIVNKIGNEINDENVHSTLQNTELDIKIYGEEINLQVYKDVIKSFIDDAVAFYEEHIMDLESSDDKVIVYFFDEYWEVLTKRLPRKLSTIYLNGKEKEMYEYIKKFKSKEVKERYGTLGIPYKKNIMFEGYPGTGKTSLIFALASELNYNIAILNFNRSLDDNAFMRAIRKLPKNSILVLEDIDVLFKERKENDGYKSNISFSALLNTLDGIAFRDEMISIMTTNYECNLDSALKRPGRIDLSLNFSFATKGQTKFMFQNFFPDNKESFEEFYKTIKRLKYTTAILQQYFMCHMDNFEGLSEGLEEFKELCEKHNYDKKLSLYA